MIRSENETLKQQISELKNNQRGSMDSTGSGSEQIERIKELLREKEPKLEELLDEALRMEKSNQEKKDQKILEILQYKDKQIEDFQMVHSSY